MEFRSHRATVRTPSLITDAIQTMARVLTLCTLGERVDTVFPSAGSHCAICSVESTTLGRVTRRHSCTRRAPYKINLRRSPQNGPTQIQPRVRAEPEMPPRVHVEIRELKTDRLHDLTELVSRRGESLPREIVCECR